MNKTLQKTINSTINALFEKYGTINQLEVTRNSIIYSFLCDSNKLFKKDDILYHLGIIKFVLLTKSSYECFIYSFRVGTAKGIKKNIYPLINKANASLEYGKYILASNDIDWEFKIDLRYTTDEDIYNILKIFMVSLLNLAVDINNEKHKKNEKA